MNGGVWRYAMGKNMWKIDFNRGHYLQARDNYGRPYMTRWAKLNLRSSKFLIWRLLAIGFPCLG